MTAAIRSTVTITSPSSSNCSTINATDRVITRATVTHRPFLVNSNETRARLTVRGGRRRRLATWSSWPDRYGKPPAAPRPSPRSVSVAFRALAQHHDTEARACWSMVGALTGAGHLPYRSAVRCSAPEGHACRLDRGSRSIRAQVMRAVQTRRPSSSTMVTS